ncbi:hypothetical protein [Polyangium sp. y55x31]|uniref:hypothetical protein n=1 Tax=Polyangium sp. y55x31 TaxID=3042688 RepID=UPI00248325E5|nr:hypothetical protein [Polyangium sp. y55x31]MDI1475740.1 hypothetical protein [Polyangium sp. y55x31]
MSPYREKRSGIDQGPEENAEQQILHWTLLGLGVLLVVYEIGQPAPFGSVGTLGMLILILALRGLVGPYVTRLRHGGRGGRT